MRGPLSHPAEVIRRIDDAASEVVQPDAVHNRAPGQWMIVAAEPLGQRDATLTLVMIFQKVEARLDTRDEVKRARRRRNG